MISREVNTLEDVAGVLDELLDDELRLVVWKSSLRTMAVLSGALFPLLTRPEVLRKWIKPTSTVGVKRHAEATS